MKVFRPLACALALITTVTLAPIAAEAHSSHHRGAHRTHTRSVARVHRAKTVRIVRGSHRRHEGRYEGHHGRAVHAGAGSGGAIAFAMRFLGHGNPTGTRGPWCGDFMNFVVEHGLGRKGIKSRMAPDWARYGRPSGPIPGAIVVFRGHVGTVMERIGNQIKVISGNYSHRVGIGMYSIRSAIAFRMP